MRAVIKLEMWGAYGGQQYMGWDRVRPWVAKITGFDEEFGYKRTFQRGQWDYSAANSTGTRGIYAYYPLASGLYEIHERISWKHTRRYFILVDAPNYREISREEVMAWLTNAASE